MFVALDGPAPPHLGDSHRRGGDIGIQVGIREKLHMVVVGIDQTMKNIFLILDPILYFHAFLSKQNVL